jgi:hypothetical protein
MEHTQKTSVTPKDFFLYLGVSISLYWSAGSLLALLFEIINKSIPDQLSYYSVGFDSGMRFAIASLIIIFPVYLVLSRIVAQGVRREPAKIELWVRKWFMYFTLFIAGAVVVGDLVALVNSLLGGELTTRFILKTLAVLVIAAVIFGYYLYQMRTHGGSSKVGKILISASVLGVLLAIIGGFVVMGSPSAQRTLRFDQERTGDLENIQWQVSDYYRNKGTIPGTLSEITGALGVESIPMDPETGEAYTYTKVAPLSFELCATFGTESRADAFSYAQERALPAGIEGSNSWEHTTGEVCFSRTIDPDYFKSIR